MVLGAALLLGALALFTGNQTEAAEAEKAAAHLLTLIVESIEDRQETAQTEAAGTEPVIIPGTPPELLDPSVLKMTEVEIDGYTYIGYLSIPSLNLELPIMADWDYARLKISPCRYAGTVNGGNLVLMAHNYARHFGKLSQLTVGDEVIFVDMDGVVTRYEVAAMDILAPTAVEEMTSGEFDLTLFTCTYGGRSRVTVYCNRI